MESGTSYTLTLRDLILLVARASWAVNDADAERVLNWYANELEEKMDVSRKDLQEVFDSLDIVLWDNEEEDEESGEEDQRSVGNPCERCTHQTASMPDDMTGENRLCADCYWDLDKERKYQRAREVR